MGPFEYLWLTVFLIFIMIAFVRGYNKELGTTTLIFVALFLITYFGIPKLGDLINDIYHRIFNATLSERQMEHILATTFSLVFIAIVFASYAGDTFAFKGKPARGLRGGLFNLLVGAINGYLIAGSLWYFQDFYNYPVTDFGILNLPLTTTGELIANYLPPYVIPPMFWAALVAIMLIFRVRK